jgi:hypothetical protein
MTISLQESRTVHPESLTLKSCNQLPYNDDPGGSRTRDLRIKRSVPENTPRSILRHASIEVGQEHRATQTGSDAGRQPLSAKSPTIRKRKRRKAKARKQRSVKQWAALGRKQRANDFIALIELCGLLPPKRETPSAGRKRLQSSALPIALRR